MERVAIAIAGATASGKTTLAEALARRLPCAVLRTDDYYRPLDHLTYEERCRVNFDHPDAIDHDLLASHINQLLGGRTASIPQYDFSRHTRFDRTLEVGPAPFLIVEGLFALCYPNIRALCSVTVFVDTPEEECLRRRIVRDIRERGRTPVEVVERFSAHVAPMFRAHVAPTRLMASLVVPGVGDPAQGVEQIVGLLNRPAAHLAV